LSFSVLVGLKVLSHRIRHGIAVAAFTLEFSTRNMYRGAATRRVGFGANVPLVLITACRYRTLLASFGRLTIKMIKC